MPSDPDRLTLLAGLAEAHLECAQLALELAFFLPESCGHLGDLDILGSYRAHRDAATAIQDHILTEITP
jgi:hypothetical protein